jgi:hypothetical protein
MSLINNIDARSAGRNRSGARSLLNDLAFSGESSNFSKAVVVDILNDPSLIITPNSPFASLQIANATYLRLAPRNSIVVKKISNAAGNTTANQCYICFPFFPPHLSLPINAGETVWIFSESGSDSDPLLYWVARVSDLLGVDDINYTHSDRRFHRQTLQSLSDRNERAESQEEEVTPSFPNGTGTRDGFTLMGDPLEYDKIVFRSSGYAQTVKEAVPRYTKRPGELVFQGSNNALIALTLDRQQTDENGITSSAVSKNIQSSISKGAIDIVVGRGQTAQTAPRIIKNSRGYEEVDKTPALRDSTTNQSANPKEGDPDFINDLSRIYVAMRSDLDKKLNLTPYSGATSTEQVDNDAFVALKSNNIRLVARENGTIRIVKEGQNLATLQVEKDGTIIIDGPKIILGTGAQNQTFLGDGATEPVILGDTFLSALDGFLQELVIAVGNLGIPLTTINAASATFLAKIETFKSTSVKVK